MSPERLVRGSSRALHPWSYAAGACLLLVASALLALELAWTGGPTVAFVGWVGVGTTLLLATFRWVFESVDSDGEAVRLTLATWITVSRAAAVPILAGFVAGVPDGALAWIPVLLVAVAAALDAVDGWVARATDSVTSLGGRLDREVDGLIVLVGAVVVVSAGLAPLAFLAVGLARYGFVAGVALRERRGNPVGELPPNPARRPLGAAAMIAILVALLPGTEPRVAWLLTAAVTVPFLANFTWDYLSVTRRG